MTEEVDLSTKEHLSIVIVGHVDAGKSTTTGHLLEKLGKVDKREVERLKKIAKDLGRESFGYAFVTDNNKEERERGITQSCNVKEFWTKSKHFSIIDAPGHRDFVKNMIKGSSQADVAQLMVPATGFEAAIAKEDKKNDTKEGQTRQHAALCKLFGIEQLIVCVNKMDAVGYSEERYNEIIDEVKRMIQDVGYKNLKKVAFIPISGFTGENLTEPSTNMPWYKGWSVQTKNGDKIETITGTTLVDALDAAVKAPKQDLVSAPLMPVGGLITNVPGVPLIVTGRVERGVFKKNDKVRFFPSGATGTVFSVEMHHRKYDRAEHNQNVGIAMKGLDKKAGNWPRKGDVMLLDDPSRYPDHYGRVKSINASVQVLNHTGILKAANADGKGGFTPICFVRQANVPFRLTKVHKKMVDKKTGEMADTGENFLKKGDVAEVTLEPTQGIYCTSFKHCKGLGRVGGLDSNKLVFVAKLNSVEYEPLK